MATEREQAMLSPFLARITVLGMSLAVLALGGLSVWSAVVTERDAVSLTQGGVQITGQLSAVQALYVVRMETDVLEDDFSQAGVARLREAIRTMPGELARMESGDSREAVRVARLAEPLAEDLGPAVERFLADPMSDINYRGEGEGDDTAEDAMEKIIDELERLLNDSGSDPAQLLNGKLANVTEASRAVRRAATVLIPAGLGAVIVCGYLLRRYRRRSDETMRAAMAITAREARTDQLTGLPNRRAVIEELHRRIDAGESFTFAMADLNGFKHYNDTYGHPAGDALLSRLGHKLSLAWQGHGYAARLGGDEFCVISDHLDPDRTQALLQDALNEQGEGFSISAVSGVAAVPAEAVDPSAALGLADTRLYAAKAVHHGAKGNPRSHPAPTLHHDLDITTQLAVACADVLNLPAERVAEIERAAQLHDVGKAGLPAAILAKQGTLTEAETGFIRRYTSIGERLLTTIDDLEPVAAIVGSSQERWDGAGYPDQLAGEQIPIGSRIIAVATAFTAMTSDRPHAAARSVAQAVAEVERCSGTQFDPTVVAAFTETVTRFVPAERAH